MTKGCLYGPLRMGDDGRAGGCFYNSVCRDSLQGLLSVLLQRKHCTRSEKLFSDTERGEEGSARQPEHGLHAAVTMVGARVDTSCSCGPGRATSITFGSQMDAELVIVLIAVLPLCQGLPSLAGTLDVHSDGRTSSPSSEGSMVKKGGAFAFRTGRTDREASSVHRRTMSLIILAYCCMIEESTQG